MNELLQRGIEAARAGRPRDAAHCFVEALTVDGDDPIVRAWLGQALCASRRQNEGTQELRRAAATLLDQGKAAALPKVIEIAVQLQQWADVSGALALCERLSQLHPESARVHQLHAMGLHQLNRPAEALAACRRAAALAPDDAMLEVLQASIEFENRLTDAAERRLQAVLTRQIPPLVRFRALKELARTLDKVAAYEAAFATLREAEAISRTVSEFQLMDLGLVPGMIAANLKAYTPELMGRWAQTQFDDRGAPVFIVGFYRSGTTLVQEVLDTHPRCFVADEAPLIHEALRELHTLRPTPGSATEKLRSLDAAEIARLRHAYWDTARGRYGGEIDGRIFIDKFTLNTVDLGFINTVFPDAKVIVLLRDPRDVCLSSYMQMMPMTAATAHLLTWERTAAFYAEVMSWWTVIRDRLTVPWIEMRYEDAVLQFQPTFRQVLGFIGLEWDPALFNFHERAAGKFVGSPSRHQVAQPLFTSSLQRWRHYAAYFDPVAGQLRPFVERFGYATESL